jgi:hypothetical protein
MILINYWQLERSGARAQARLQPGKSRRKEIEERIERRNQCGKENMLMYGSDLDEKTSLQPLDLGRDGHFLFLLRAPRGGGGFRGGGNAELHRHKALVHGLQADEHVGDVSGGEEAERRLRDG